MTDIHTPPEADGFVPTQADIDEIHAWFQRYEARLAAGDIEGMADMAMFPLNEVSSGGDGNGSARTCGREDFVAQMTGLLDGAGELSMESTRTPHFISEHLVFVVTDATITEDGRTRTVRYGDLLVKSNGQWVFQTMVQGGWD